MLDGWGRVLRFLSAVTNTDSRPFTPDKVTQCFAQGVLLQVPAQGRTSRANLLEERVSGSVGVPSLVRRKGRGGDGADGGAGKADWANSADLAGGGLS
jgi:hypothetical protein